MKSSKLRRLPKKISNDDDEEDPTSVGTMPLAKEPVVKRPSKTKRQSSLRMSIGDQNEDDDDDSTPAVIRPEKKKSTLGRTVMERNAERKTIQHTANHAASHLPFRAGGEDDRPSYSKDDLAELKSSTPSTPQKQQLGDEDPNISISEASIRDLHIAAKFGPLASLVDTRGNPAIPTNAEIQEKKARRARLAKEQDFISLEAASDPDRSVHSEDDAISDDEFSRGIVPRREAKPGKRDKWGTSSSRLVRDDEDFAEGFEDFVEDGGSRIVFSRDAERDAARRRREEISGAIQDAADESSEGDSDAERNAAYEAAQTRAGTYRNRDHDEERRQRDRTPPRIAPLPQMKDVLAHLNEVLAAVDQEKLTKTHRLDQIKAERKEIGESMAWVQSQLDEVGERYKKLSEEAGLNGNQDDKEFTGMRGLESIGSVSTPFDGRSGSDGI